VRDGDARAVPEGSAGQTSEMMRHWLDSHDARAA
jgi:hypothetical protein